ncbi:MAG: L,D-transpeptidase [Euryarchaeota archaeon]|nr:L,D-transpeptidase [Euryarchaeota archaeon]
MSISVSSQRMIVSIKWQKLFLIKADCPPTIYPISTSKNPPSCKEGSFGTPLGLHTVAEKIGAGATRGTVFKGRVPQAYTYENAPPEEREKNLITTRIIRIRGLEAGLNSGKSHDSFERYIYLHGTNHEAQIGQPFSMGCIELKNEDIERLYDRVAIGDLLYIK